MDFRDLTVGILFLSQTSLGILGNCAILSHFILADFTGSRMKPTHLIVKHLIWANLMVLLFKGVPQTAAVWGHIYLLDDSTCKIVFYLHRVARGVSLSSTSILSIFQAIVISPSNSTWVQFKFRAPKIVGPALGMCWTLQLLVNTFIPMTVTDIVGGRNLSGFRDFIYCAVVQGHSLTNILYSTLLISFDAMGLGLMMWASGSMVLVLMKHKQRVQHIHSSQSPQSSPETRATHSILALVSSFVLFYIISSILTLYWAFLDGSNRWLVNANVLITACFPAFCPFLLISKYSSVLKLWWTSSYRTEMAPVYTESSQSCTMCAHSIYISMQRSHLIYPMKIVAIP